MQDQEMAIAIRDLKTYARKDWEMEIGEQTIKDINSLPEQDALWYIRNLRDKPWQVRATRKNQMDVSGIVITMDTFVSHPVTTLYPTTCFMHVYLMSAVEYDRTFHLFIEKPHV